MRSALLIICSLVGSLIGLHLSKHREGSTFHPSDFLVSILAAIVLLVSWVLVR